MRGMPSVEEIIQALADRGSSAEELLRSLGKRVPSADDVVRALGLNRRSRTSDLLPGLALFGAGVLVGAGLALFLAPVTGRELREEIGEHVSELRERMASGDGETKEEAR